MSLTSFFNNFKSSKDRNILLDGKEAEFYGIYLDVTDLKIRPMRATVTTQHLVSKSGQNAEKPGIWLIFKPFSRLTIRKCPYDHQINGLNPNTIPHSNASKLLNTFKSHL